MSIAFQKIMNPNAYYHVRWRLHAVAMDEEMEDGNRKDLFFHVKVNLDQ